MMGYYAPSKQIAEQKNNDQISYVQEFCRYDNGCAQGGNEKGIREK